MSRKDAGRHLRGKVAVAGIGNTRRWDAPGRTAFDQLSEAVHLALTDAGLSKNDVDGLFCTLSVTGLPLLNVTERLGLQPRYFDGSMVGGSSFFGQLRSALLAVEAGLCSVALICYGSNQRSAGGKLVSLPDPQPSEAPYRPLYPISSYALATARHMHEYGTTREQLAEVALAARAWARRNPAAFKREPLTREEVLNSRPISDPLTRADCCLVTDGGGAMLLVAAERARDLPKPPVYLLGVGAALSHRQIANMPDLTATCALESGQQAYAMAGLGPEDMQMAQLYDAFTINTLLFLEDLGFCPKGEGGRFVEEGAIAPGGRLPVNTNGGGLSCNHPGMYGLFPMIEAVEQLRGEAGERQVPGVEVALAHGNGGVLSSQATAIFGTAAAL